MLFSNRWLAALVAASSFASAAPSSHSKRANSTCTSVSQRKAWHTLSDMEKQAYLEAEVILFNSPSKEGFIRAVNRFDDLHFVHINYTNIVHDVGGFLPWHRYYMHAREHLLRTECTYTGYQPYWDEQYDTATYFSNASQSAIFDADTGFGGNGTGSDSCINSGPFANVTLHLGPAYEITDHCISRVISTTSLTGANTTYLDECYAAQNYSSAYPLFSSHPHTAGHATVPGVMLDITASPGDPIFYLHHTNLDRLWWNWQAMDLPSRLTDMAGQNVPDESYIVGQGLYNVTDAWLDYDGDEGNVTTLNYTLSLVGLMPNVTVGDVVDIQGGLLCYEYV